MPLPERVVPLELHHCGDRLRLSVILKDDASVLMLVTKVGKHARLMWRHDICLSVCSFSLSDADLLFP